MADCVDEKVADWRNRFAVQVIVFLVVFGWRFCGDCKACVVGETQPRRLHVGFGRAFRRVRSATISVVLQSEERQLPLVMLFLLQGSVQTEKLTQLKIENSNLLSFQASTSCVNTNQQSFS